MLKEDQAAELLRRCEIVVGQSLTKIRSALLDAEVRASAVWELLCIDAFSKLGHVAYERLSGYSRPDLLLSIQGCADVAIEAAYVYPRNWRNDRRARDVLQWVYSQAKVRNIPEFRISSHFFGDPTNRAGPVRNLPAQHDKNQVLRSEAFVSFFAAIAERPSEIHEATISPYSVRLKYDPSEVGQNVHGSSSVEESPTVVEEHALFRSLQTKARQHYPSVPYVVCVGTDQSTAITRHVGLFGINERDAVAEIFAEYSRVSAVITVGLEDSLSDGFRRVAMSRMYHNPRAANPLHPGHTAALLKLDFNRWKFYFALEKWDSTDMSAFEKSGGSLQFAPRKEGISMSIPTTVLVDCLAGKCALKDHYPDAPGISLLACVEDGWQVIGCSFSPGDIQQGKSSTITLDFARPGERVYFGR
jgi:hypothetical protein